MKQIDAAMAGTVLSVLVKKGDEVKAGDQVAMLESMKMEIPVEAVEDGVVSDVKVDMGDFINEGDTLIVMD
ncbi:acetyl-CoA carboxylase biotin carboxyl carrier protein [Scopulibacillus darangshiensis]|uniref:Acetyl-CoA carboxylase biotin carboxyl carrier protein n=1 Tax=Scopulibacillus darangshiensis TaxID=442528 RepID=A0A4R2P9D7_9BACL|nr:biotin/lipoyl-binding carrier protein [Scopulibacillus darangshiensis]TCP30475.1 acetyl-CoA carboxylase biotin carboxyl carrier protein [Scopulibacillus darangshiensis]